MGFTLVNGTQYGDEAKGKFTDFLAEDAKGVARFQGGNNAGHTIKVAGKTYKLHYWPGGVVRPDIEVILGSGMVINPRALRDELESNQIDLDDVRKRAKISERAHITPDSHIYLDAVNDILQGKFSADSTKRGIAITYAMKSLRLGIRFVDAFSSDLESKVENQIKWYKPMINALSNEEKEKISKVLEERYHDRAAAIIESGTSFDAKKVADKLLEDVQPFKGVVSDVMPVLRKDYLAGKIWVLEGAQGMGLDVDEGIYPYTTSSNMIPGAVTHGLGIPHYYIDRVVSVVKVLTSRVGSGVQPCEIEDPLASELREKGGEYGTTTGRGRRMLWLTMPELRKAVHLSGTTDLALTKLDVLSHLSTVKDGKLKINNQYELGELLWDFGIPSSMENFANCKPVYREFEPWPELSKQEWLQIPEDGLEAVPKEMKAYVGYIAKELVPFGRNLDKGNFYLSFGPEREATLEVPTAEILEWA